MIIVWLPTILRILLVVSIPSISGIFQSIIAILYGIFISIAFLTSSTALNPESTQSVWAPISLNIFVVCWPIISSSSATSTFKPLRSSCFFLSHSLSSLSDTSLNGIVTTNEVPLFFSLSTSIAPPISWTRLYTIDRPRPLPALFLAPSCISCSNGWNSFLINSSDIPLPVSVIVNCIYEKPFVLFFSLISTITFPPQGVNLRAFDSKFINICLILSGSPI